MRRKSAKTKGKYKQRTQILVVPSAPLLLKKTAYLCGFSFFCDTQMIHKFKKIRGDI